MQAGSRMTSACFWCCVRRRERERGPARDRPMTADAGRPTKERIISAEGQDLRLFIVAGEHSGDALGAKLMSVLNARRRGRVRYVGVGGAQMAEQGLVSQFPMEDVAVMGLGAILARLPKILTRVYGTVAAAVAAEP